MIFVKHDYDHVTYAGDSLTDAQKHRGNITVWNDGKIVYTIDRSGRWYTYPDRKLVSDPPATQ